MNFEKKPLVEIKTSQACFVEKTRVLKERLVQISLAELMEKEKISFKIAQETIQAFQSFALPEPHKVRPAAMAYSGIVFNKIDAQNFSQQQWMFATKTLRIFSALYGLLSPSDEIQAYRLDMSSKIVPKLYDYWKEDINKKLCSLLTSAQYTLVNLASKEFFKLVNPSLLPQNTQVITPIFQQEIRGKMITNSLYAKQARGLMTRFIIENEITDPEYLKAFDMDGYFFNVHLTNKNNWFFTRN